MKDIDIGQKLKYYRQKKKITQKTLSKQLGVVQSTVSAWETGINVPDVYTFCQILKFLDVSLIEFFELDKTSKQTKYQKIKRQIDELNEIELDKIEFSIKILLATRNQK